MPRRQKPRSAGRPPGPRNEQVRQQLLEAAHTLFLSYEFKAVSLRSIATQADVNPAMVNYYFGSKQGLYLAMVEQMISSMETALADLPAQSGQSVSAFAEAYMQLLAANPWWPNFIVREVLFGKEQFRRQIVERFDRSLARHLLGGIRAAVAGGAYRQDLDPALAAWSLMGMMVFPFLSSPIAENLLHTRAGKENVRQLIDHTNRLFLHGVLRQEVSP